MTSRYLTLSLILSRRNTPHRRADRIAQHAANLSANADFNDASRQHWLTTYRNVHEAVLQDALNRDLSPLWAASLLFVAGLVAGLMINPGTHPGSEQCRILGDSLGEGRPRIQLIDRHADRLLGLQIEPGQPCQAVAAHKGLVAGLMIGGVK